MTTRNAEREMIERTITLDLFGPGALSEPAEFDAPEKYELLECLGRGGCGVVYKARDVVLDRPVALKFLHDARPADLERFRREARFAARLNNPSIVQVYEFADSAGQPYIAMQYIDGGNLAQAKLPMEGVLRAIREAGDALHHAHQSGIVHRDFKPANVLLDRAGRAYLTDFGIARDLGGRSGETLSHAGALMGTPALMPPEQARGDMQAIDARSDVYSVGASLYYLLCGRYPFVRGNLVDLLHAILHDEPPLPRSVNAGIPRAVEAIIVRCMRKERSRRYPDMAAVVADLSAALAGRTVDSEPTVWFRKLVGAPAAPQESSDTDLFRKLGIEIANEIAAWDANLYRVSRNFRRLYAQLDALVERLDGLVRDDPDSAWLRFYRGMALFRRGRLPEALDEMERSIDRLANQALAQFEIGRLYLTLFLKEQHSAHKHFSVVGMRYHLNDARGRLHQAVIAFRETQRLRQSLAPWQLEFADAVTRLADEDYDGCVATCDRILAADADLESVWKLRGDALRFGGGDPFESYAEAVRVRRSDHESYMAMAEAYLERDRVSEARAALGAVLAILPESTDAMTQLARACRLDARRAHERGDAAGADELRRQGLDLTRRVLALQPDDYEAEMTRAELLIESARAAAQPKFVDDALAAVERAKSLKGCQNRVGFVAANCHLERAKLLRQRGGDPNADLRRVFEYAHHDAVRVPDNEPWMRLLEAANAESAALRLPRSRDTRGEHPTPPAC